jgi:hypothetical protein
MYLLIENGIASLNLAACCGIVIEKFKDGWGVMGIQNNKPSIFIESFKTEKKAKEYLENLTKWLNGNQIFKGESK